MNLLITGGCGHIGSYLIQKLDHSQHKITVVDNLLTQRYCSLFNLKFPINFIDKCISEITVEDLKDIDVVIHLAAITNAAGSFDNKKETEKVNLKLTNKFIDVCEESKVKFIFPSSTSVYGTAADTVHEDNDLFLNPQSPYAKTKIGIERRLRQYQSEYLILRFGTIFGTSIGMRFHTAINKFCYEASLGKPLTIWKQNYEHYRPYLGLKDAVDSIMFFLKRNNWNETYNVLTGNYRLKDIIEYISQVMDVQLNMVDTPLLNQYSYNVSDKKIKNIGFDPDDNLEDNIVRTLRTLRNLK